MRFGYFLPNFMAKGISVDSLLSLAEYVDQHSDVDDIWVGDHVVLMDRIRSRHPNFGRDLPPGTLEDFTRAGLGGMSASDPLLEPLTLLSFLAGRTSRVGLGTGILVVPLREPVLGAKMLAAVDTLSDGRLIVATGTGWLREEYEALGVPWERRGARTDDYVACMRYLWGPESADGFESRTASVPVGVRMHPKPPQGADIPIWVGGNTGVALRRAARLGTGWHGAQLAPEAAAEAVGELRAMLVEGGRDPAGFTMSLRLTTWISAGGTDVDGPLAGTAEQIHRALLAYGDAGVDHVQFAPPPMTEIAALPEQVERLAGVMEQLRA